MYCAVLADIHSNLEAFTRVLEELETRKPDRILLVGDVVGYGADPNECCKLARERCHDAILGNHDEAVWNVALRDAFNPEARTAIEWTAGVLSDENKTFLRSFSRMMLDVALDLAMTHGSPREPEAYHYLFSSADAELAFKHFDTSACFVAHTHVPTLHSVSGEMLYLAPGRYPLDRKERCVLNPGSVGQPRDRDPRTSFALFDTEKFELEIVRLRYDNQGAAEKIRRAGLPRFLADRLL